jgi:hypothetical protein
MRKTLIAIATAAAMVPGGAWAADYPFVGKWSCEVADFTFTNRTYNNGSETIPILKVERRGGSYHLVFTDGYVISLSSIKAGTMVWHRIAPKTDGDMFSCRRKRK